MSAKDGTTSSKVKDAFLVSRSTSSRKMLKEKWVEEITQ